MGKNREAVCLRRRQGKRNAGGSVRRAQPADHLPLHVRPWMERGMSELLVSGRFVRWIGDPPGAAGYDNGGRVTRHSARDRCLQKAHGMEVQVGVFEWK